MTVKNYGAGVSGYLDPEDRAWESTIYQAGKPVLDSELNLVQDIEQGADLGWRRRAHPSGWLSDDFLGTSDAVSSIFVANTTANRLQLPQDLRAIVNGWVVRIGHTNANGSNVLDLGAAPSGAGAKRTDLVILEVWRRLVTADSADGKSAAGRIWWNGNVKIAGADDLTLNFADDIQDPNVGAPTTKRVQVQYRLRVIQGVDIFAYPFGIDDPSVVARSVPAAAAAPDGTATVFTYTNQSANGDPGLWRAGDGTPGNTLGSVDGYMYAVPLLAVFRRNSTAFARNTNHNGGVAYPGPSDRPDGLFHDIVAGRDIADLRMGVSLSGWDYPEILDKNVGFLFDNALRTEITGTSIGGGLHGNTHLWADEIGVANANGGDGLTTGDTPGATFVGQFDAVRRRFSDRSILEVATLRYTPADAGLGGNWTAGATLTINPSALPIYPYAAFNWTAFAPSNISILDIQSFTFAGASSGKRYQSGTGDGFSVHGLGEVPQGSLTVTLDSVPANITDEPLYLQVLFGYPPGAGLTKTATDTFGTSGVGVNNPVQLPATAPVEYEALVDTAIDAAHREVALTYRTVSRQVTISGPNQGSVTSVRLPERAASVSVVELNGGPVAFTLQSDGYEVSVAPSTITAGDELEVTFKALRALPQNGEQVTIYYEARAPQTVREGSLGTSLAVIPRYIAPYLYVLVAGSGSQIETFPFPYAYAQSGGVYPTSGGTFEGDHELNGFGQVSLADFSADAGMVRLSAHIPMVPSPEGVVLERAPGDVDAEGRSFFKQMDGAGTVYPLSAAAQGLSDPRKHKVIQPMLAELAADSGVGRKGQLVLVLVSRWAMLDDDNSVGFIDDLSQNTTTASVYRVKGNLLNNRRG